MVKESWGKKRTCPKCDKDLICPHTFSLEFMI